MYLRTLSAALSFAGDRRFCSLVRDGYAVGFIEGVVDFFHQLFLCVDANLSDWPPGKIEALPRVEGKRCGGAVVAKVIRCDALLTARSRSGSAGDD
jgi:hypothetical protein